VCAKLNLWSYFSTQKKIDSAKQGMTKSQDFWNDKMTHLFYLYDADRDGSITSNDFDILATKLSSLIGLSGENSQKCSEDYAAARRKLMNEIMRADANHDGKVTLDEWLDFHKRLANELRKPDTDPLILEQFSDRIDTTFKMLDLNHDGIIEKAEWIKTCEFFGVEKNLAESSFAQIAEGGKLNEDEAKQLFFEYIISENPNHLSNCCLCFL